MRKPPINLTQYTHKMPKRCHALLVILDGGKVEHPEFVAYSWDEFADELAKWKKAVLPTLKRSNVDFWELHNGDHQAVNLLNR